MKTKTDAAITLAIIDTTNVITEMALAGATARQVRQLRLPRDKGQSKLDRDIDKVINTTIKGAANILAAGGSVRKMRQTMLAAAR